MNRIIYKYVVGNAAYGDRITPITVPSQAQFLSVRQQNTNICAWYLIDPEDIDTREDLWYQIGTGHKFDPNGMSFIDTIVAEEFGYVWHMWLSVKNNYECL